jgi:hypothetical protein
MNYVKQKRIPLTHELIEEVVSLVVGLERRR